MHRSFRLFASTVLMGCNAPTATATREAPKPLAGLEIAEVTACAQPQLRSYIATLRAGRDATLGSAAGGVVEAVQVQLGDRVQRGGLLVQLQSANARSSALGASAALAEARARTAVDHAHPGSPEVQSAQIALATARDARERMDRFAGQNAISEQELLRLRAQEQAAEVQLRAAVAASAAARAGVEQAQAQVAQATTLLADTSLRAPFEGVVAERFVAAGEYAAAGTPLIRLVDISEYRLEFDVAQHEATDIAVGALVLAQTGPAPGTLHLRGKVTRLSQALNAQTRTLRAEAVLDSPPTSLFANMRWPIQVAFGAATEWQSVPCTAVRTRAGVARVFQVRAQRLVEVLVEIGPPATDGESGRCLTRSALAAGDKVLRVPPVSAHDGDAVAP